MAARSFETMSFRHLQHERINCVRCAVWHIGYGALLGCTGTLSETILLRRKERTKRDRQVFLRTFGEAEEYNMPLWTACRDVEWPKAGWVRRSDVEYKWRHKQKRFRDVAYGGKENIELFWNEVEICVAGESLVCNGKRCDDAGERKKSTMWHFTVDAWLTTVIRCLTE